MSGSARPHEVGVVSAGDEDFLRQGGEGPTGFDEISTRGTEALVQRQHKTRKTLRPWLALVRA
jgi:hypothetical protein